MSVDYHLVCGRCSAHIHVGQTMAGSRFTAGFGPRDIPGQEQVGDFLLRHQGPCRPLLFTNADQVPTGCRDEGSP
jgi:hypothetical protein